MNELQATRGRGGGPASVLLEVLNLALVLLRLLEIRKRPQVPPLSRGSVLLARVQPVFTRFQFADHVRVDAPALLAYIEIARPKPQESP